MYKDRIDVVTDMVKNDSEYTEENRDNTIINSILTDCYEVFNNLCYEVIGNEYVKVVKCDNLITVNCVEIIFTDDTTKIIGKE